MQLSEKQKTFSQYFLPLWNLDSILNVSKKKKMSIRADAFFKLQTPKKVVRWISKKSRFRGRFDK